MKLRDPLFTLFVAHWFSLERFGLSKIVRSTSIEARTESAIDFNIESAVRKFPLDHEVWNIVFQP